MGNLFRKAWLFIKGLERFCYRSFHFAYAAATTAAFLQRAGFAKCLNETAFLRRGSGNIF
ncbi:hypothetical protein D3H65_32605 [Paraflavitalea soli]|uniref:Uncharacterized protein n=1 Tax=Paraflavitalea soli TaxID=2315862 RepID=A0A3B7MY24_9BACT|nr:hypothetical protein D3H65_32605 [Paraflavitalea soli]